MKKNNTPLFLLIAMAMALALTALAAPDDFTVTDGVLTAYTGTDFELIIPEGVTAIAAEAFANHPELETLIIPSAVSDIAAGAFDGCPNLKLHVVEGSFAESFADVYALFRVSYPSDDMLPEIALVEGVIPSAGPSEEADPPLEEPSPEPEYTPETEADQYEPEPEPLVNKPTVFDILKEPEDENLITIIVMAISLLLFILLIITISTACKSRKTPPPSATPPPPKGKGSGTGGSRGTASRK